LSDLSSEGQKFTLDIEHVFCYYHVKVRFRGDAMLTTQERMEVFHEVLNRLAPEMRARLTTDLTPRAAAPAVSLQGLLYRLGPVPHYSALIGMCEDGLPFLFDLKDPSAGSILIVGDENSGKTHLLQTVLSSASALNPPEDVMFSVITTNPGRYQSMEKVGNCNTVLSAYDRLASELVVELAELTEERRYGRNRGNVEILAIDDLAAFVQNNDYEVNAYLKWLVEHGPSSAVWSIATILPAQAWRIGGGLQEAFGAQLTGWTSSHQLSPEIQPQSVNQGDPEMFIASLGDEWVRFWVPEIH
jgi:hypothetical protein